jgi:hypothetical protein
MIFVFLSFEAIEIAYTDEIDPAEHIVICEKSAGVYEVIKEGRKLQQFLNKISEIKNQHMLEDSHDLLQ